MLKPIYFGLFSFFEFETEADMLCFISKLDKGSYVFRKFKSSDLHYVCVLTDPDFVVDFKDFIEGEM